MVERLTQNGHFVMPLYLKPTVIITVGVLVQFPCSKSSGKK
jgi:hypothetical protein